ncbi:MAG: hypothetical protein AB7O26_18635, partial [Planctomycetaceae bacterium]
NKFTKNDSTGEAERDEAADSDYDVTISEPITPQYGCPQCRYYRLNQRIQSLADHPRELYLIDHLVDSLKKDPDDLDTDLCARVNSVWKVDDPDAVETINIDAAVQAFANSRELDIVPPL